MDVFGVVTRLVSMDRFGTGSGNNSSFFFIYVVARTARYVAFSSGASDLVANDTNGSEDVFVRDLQMGTTTLVSVNRFGTGSGNGSSSDFGVDSFAIRTDGHCMAFISRASDLVAHDTRSSGDVFVRELQMGTTTLVSINRFGTGSGNGFSGFSAISPDRPVRGIQQRCERFGGTTITTLIPTTCSCGICSWRGPRW